MMDELIMAGYTKNYIRRALNVYEVNRFLETNE
jgi:hypothetical protein